MQRYITLLRGINISGKNKIAMPELKQGFAELGFSEVKTCLNSGNVAFSCAEADTCALSARIRAMIKDRFNLDIPVYTLPQERLRELLNNAPDWWGSDNKEIYDNLIFILPPLTFSEVYEELGSPRAEYERIQPLGDVIFWSFSRKDYQKTNWWSKTASAPIGGKLTIRTAGTVKKLTLL